MKINLNKNCGAKSIEKEGREISIRIIVRITTKFEFLLIEKVFRDIQRIKVSGGMG